MQHLAILDRSVFAGCRLPVTGDLDFSVGRTLRCVILATFPRLESDHRVTDETVVYQAQLNF